MTILIKNGTVVSAEGSTQADVLIDGERIAAVLAPGDTTLGATLAASVDRVIDATGKYVVPGGIDGHTHMEMPFGGTVASDSFETGTRAAAWGGTTTIIDFAVQKQGERVQDCLAAWHEKAGGNTFIDYGFHQVVGGVDSESLKAMDELVDEGITTFKLFMAYPGVFLSSDGQILQAMQQAASNGSMIMMHAENGSAIDVLIAQATNRAIMLASLTGAPLYIVHMSAKQAVNVLQAARDTGGNFFGETCPQYLYLSLEDQLSQPGFEGAKWVCSTPLRSKAEEHQKELWRYLRTNDLSVISTDHCPFCFKEQKEMGIGNFAKIPNGIGSVEHRMDLIYQGVVDGEISLQRWVELCSTTPARMFGLYGRKGAIAPGFDADVVIYDPAGRTEIGFHKTHHMNMDHSAWEGFVIDGHVDVTISRGEILVENGEFHGRKGHGQFLRRGLSQYLI